MKNKIFQSFMISLFLLFITTSVGIGKTQEAQKKTTELSITSWLLLGPFPTPLPALHKENKKESVVKDLLKFKEIDISKLKPEAETSFKWRDGHLANWKEIKAEENSIKLSGDDVNPTIAYLGVYVDIKRWTEAKISLKSPQPIRIWLDGEVVATKAKVDSTEKEKTSVKGRKVSADLKLETGKHLLLVKTVYDPSLNSEWILKGVLSFEEKFASPPPAFTLSAEKQMAITHLLDGPKVVGISVSPDGTLAALSIRKTLPPSDDSESWVEMYRVADGRLIQTYRGGTSISKVNWAPIGKKFSYITRKKSEGTIWIVDLKTGTSFPLLENIKNLGKHVWSPDASFLLYSVTEKGKKDKPGVKRFKNLADRQPQWRDRSYLYKVSVPEGVSQRLTAGEFSTFLNSISPDGKKLLFTRSMVDYSERPYSKTELFSLNLETLETQLIWKGKWFGRAQWSPQGKKLLILGGPSAFGDKGVNVPKDLIPNEYDDQAYLFDLKTKKVDPITKNFDPSINRALWSKTENCIYFTTTDRSYRHLYRYDLDKKKFSLIECGVEVIGRLDIADKNPIAVYTGSSASSPPKAFVINLKNKKFRILQDPGKKDFGKVRFGNVEQWTFKNKRGTEIKGRVYYPPDFDSTKKYPCFVYYYGGTTPVTRDFGGRYPKNLYAAQGYVVYVLQPSGAIGFGQKFSALHVNDWGIIVADEIINGVKKFLEAHPFVDPQRVGCIGASYGGFMTMLLLTRTDIFAAGVAHAGISSISSYWGEGYWGYGYNAFAAANSFPWNRKDIYVNQSALFHADKITTPLLLLHGSVDTNVPPGESTQLYTALKILGREVEYIQIFDQNHHIMTYNKRILWTKTIMAWYDRWLKGQAEWWNDLYPAK